MSKLLDMLDKLISFDNGHMWWQAPLVLLLCVIVVGGAVLLMALTALGIATLLGIM